MIPKLYEMIANLTIGIWLINYLGPESQGKISFLVSFFMLLNFLPSLGIGPILSRTISNSNNDNVISSRVSISVTTRLLGYYLMCLIAISFLWSTKDDLIILSIPFLLGKLFFSLNIYQNLTEGTGGFEKLALSKVISITVINIYRLICIYYELETIYVAISFFLQDFMQFICFYLLYDKGRYVHWNWNRLKIVSILKKNYKLSFSVVVVGLFTQLDIVMIGLAMGDKSAGIYYASTRLTTPMGMISGIIMGACFSYLVSYWDSGEKTRYFRAISFIVLSMLSIYVLYIITVYFFGKDIFFMFFSKKYENALSLYYIHSLGVMFIFLGAVSGRHLIVMKDYNSELQKTLFAALVNFIMNLVAIYVYDSLTLVAISSVFGYMFANYLYFYLKNDANFLRAINSAIAPVIVKEAWCAIKKNKVG